MDRFYNCILLLLLICYYLRKRHEGFFNFDECNPRDIILDEKCEMKWGKPSCNPWKTTPELKNIMYSRFTPSYRSYKDNHYLYELDYGEFTEEPKPINSTFFS